MVWFPGKCGVANSKMFLYSSANIAGIVTRVTMASLIHLSAFSCMHFASYFVFQVFENILWVISFYLSNSSYLKRIFQ